MNNITPTPPIIPLAIRQDIASIWPPITNIEKPIINRIAANNVILSKASCNYCVCLISDCHDKTRYRKNNTYNEKKSCASL